jgi:hypothetical protein
MSRRLDHAVNVASVGPALVGCLHLGCHWGPFAPLLATTLVYVEKVRPQFLSLRHYNVLLCIQLFESTAKTTSSATKAVAVNSAMLPVPVANLIRLVNSSESGQASAP